MIMYFLLGSLVAYFLVTIIYRVHIHPLSKFPGPRLAAVSGLYEIYFAAWGTGSFEDEIDRMHQEYGPVVRITPDEVHVREQFYNTRHADSWIKGSQAINPGRHQSGYTSRGFQIRKRSISRVRSILQVEVHQIIRGLVRKHQVHRVFSWRFRPFTPISKIPGVPVDAAENGDLEDGHHRPSSSSPPSGSKQMPRSQFPREVQPLGAHPGLWDPSKVKEQFLQSTKQKTGLPSLDHGLPF